MRIVVCPDTFKGTLSSPNVAAAIERGLKAGAARNGDVLHVDLVPMSDGGAGLMDSVFAALPDLEPISCLVQGPVLGQQVKAVYGLNRDEGYAIVEMAKAAGLPLTCEKTRNALHTTSFGVGQLIRHAASQPAVRKLYVGVGGSSTNDAGIGALQAMGLEVTLADGSKLQHQPVVGGQLADIAELHISDTLRNFSKEHELTGGITLVCDVTNPMVGPNGATRIYGPQKGANTEAALARLESGLVNVAEVLARDPQLGPAVKTLKTMHGGGGAGGMSGVFSVVLGADWNSGAEVVSQIARLGTLIEAADAVVTGEGAFDLQTMQFEKTVAFVNKLCVGKGKPCVVVCGVHKHHHSHEHASGPQPVLVLPLVPQVTVTDAMTHPAKCLEAMLENEYTKIVDVLLKKRRASKM